MSDKIKNPSKVGKSSPRTVVKQNSGNRAAAKIPACVGLSATCIFERRKYFDPAIISSITVSNAKVYKKTLYYIPGSIDFR